ncbi:MAG: hypothetical protein ABL921_17330 [Pirellula sp.]
MSVAKKRLDELRAIDLIRYPQRQQVANDLVARYKHSWKKPDFEKYLPLLNENLKHVSAEFAFDNMAKMDSQRLSEAARLIGWTLPNNVLVGTIPVGRPVAFVEQFVDEDESLIVLSESMYLFLYLSAKVIAMCLPLNMDRDGYGLVFDLESSIDAIKNNPSIKHRFEDVLHCTLFNVDLGVFASEQYLVDPTRQTFAGVIADLSEMLILGHEFGHLMDQKSGAPQFESGAESALHFDPIISTNWAHEIQADLTGAALVIQAGLVSELDETTILVGIDFCHTMLDIFFRSIQVARGGLECTSMEGATHPPFSLRRHFIRHVARGNFAKHEIDFSRNPGETIELIAEHLWKEVKPTVLQLAEDGNCLSPFWDA